ncbi:ras protein [Mycena filopes]|nr:ras protein [Mycena filopes]
MQTIHSGLFPRLVEDPADETYRKQMVVDNRMCHLEILDYYGIELGGVLRLQVVPANIDPWPRDCPAFVLVYSIASRASFDRMELFRQSIQRRASKDIIFILVGNKCDKAYDRQVSKEEGAALALRFGVEFMETSGKTAQNVERVFTTLVRALRRAASLESQAAEVASNKSRKTCVIY